MSLLLVPVINPLLLYAFPAALALIGAGIAFVSQKKVRRRWSKKHWAVDRLNRLDLQQKEKSKIYKPTKRLFSGKYKEKKPKPFSARKLRKNKKEMQKLMNYCYKKGLDFSLQYSKFDRINGKHIVLDGVNTSPQLEGAHEGGQAETTPNYVFEKSYKDVAYIRTNRQEVAIAMEEVVAAEPARDAKKARFFTAEYNKKSGELTDMVSASNKQSFNKLSVALLKGAREEGLRNPDIFPITVSRQFGIDNIDQPEVAILEDMNDLVKFKMGYENSLTKKPEKVKEPVVKTEIIKQP